MNHLITVLFFAVIILKPFISESQCSINSTISSTASACGGSTGSAFVTPLDGTPPYTYGWSEGSNTQSINNLAFGIYYVQITDFNGCVGNNQVLVENPNAPSALTSVTDISCFGANDGAIDLIINGGTAPYTTNWSTGEVSEDLINHWPGTYYVNIIDAASCESSTFATISEPSELTSSVLLTDVLCFGGNNGSVDLTVIGGVQPYSYDWGNNVFSEDLSNLSSGTWTVSVTDANNCTTTNNVTISEPSELTISFSITDISAAGSADGSILSSVTGGVEPYSFQWSNGSTASDLFNLSEGSYALSVTDANGCTLTQAVDLNGFNSLTESQIASGVSVYPNPFLDVFTIVYDSKDHFTVEVVNSVGQQMDFIELQKSGAGMFSIATLDWPQGIYLVKFNSDTSVWFQFLIKM